MDDTPQDPRPPDPGSGEEATNESPTPSPAFPDHPPYPSSGEPPLDPPGDLPPLHDPLATSRHSATAPTTASGGGS